MTTSTFSPPLYHKDQRDHTTQTASFFQRVVVLFKYAASIMCTEVSGAPSGNCTATMEEDSCIKHWRRQHRSPQKMPTTPIMPEVSTTPTTVASPVPSSASARRVPAPPAPEVNQRFLAWMYATSPTPPSSGDAAKLFALQLFAHAIAEVFAHILRSGCWDASFARGQRPCNPCRPATRFSVLDTKTPRTRRLATEYLSPFYADGWNVFVGAMSEVVEGAKG